MADGHWSLDGIYIYIIIMNNECMFFSHNAQYTVFSDIIIRSS